MDNLAITQALGEAYGLSFLSGQGEVAAVAHLRKAIDGGQRKAAEQKLAELGAIKKARTIGGRCGCHITAETHALLQKALEV